MLLMTLHSAKGLEFSHVYLAGLEDGVFPSYMTIVSDDPMEVEEERRLAYVGITRAKDDLTITCARQRMIRGETQYNPVSRFVKESPPLLLDHKLPKPKRDIYTSDTYDEGIGSSSSYSRGAATPYQRQFGKDADTIFDKPKAAVKPKAVVKPKRTAYEDQPYITRTSMQIARVEESAVASSKLSYEEGDRVRHMRYGEGTVMKIEPGPRDFQVTVVFDEAGQKIMYAGFAKLKKV